MYNYYRCIFGNMQTLLHQFSNVNQHYVIREYKKSKMSAYQSIARRSFWRSLHSGRALGSLWWESSCAVSKGMRSTPSSRCRKLSKWMFTWLTSPTKTTQANLKLPPQFYVVEINCVENVSKIKLPYIKPLHDFAFKAKIRFVWNTSWNTWKVIMTNSTIIIQFWITKNNNNNGRNGSCLTWLATS